METKDFAVHLHERYGQTKKDFEKSFNEKEPYRKCLCVKGYQYEEHSCSHSMPNIDFDKLFVGARLFKDVTLDNAFFSRVMYEEIEITHIYGTVAFFKWVTGELKGNEDYFDKNSLLMFLKIYPKVIYKPKGMKLECYCEKTMILDED